MLGRFGITRSVVFPTLGTSSTKLSRYEFQLLTGRRGLIMYHSSPQELLSLETVPAASPPPRLVPFNTRPHEVRREQGVGRVECCAQRILSSRLTLPAVGRKACHFLCSLPGSPATRTRACWTKTTHPPVVDDRIRLYTVLVFRYFKKLNMQLFNLKKASPVCVVCAILCHLRNGVSSDSFDRVVGNFSSIAVKRRPALGSSPMIAGCSIGGSNA
jgi:hypothetical protein